MYELLQYGQIPPSLVSEVLVQYDRAVNEALANRVKTRVNFHSVSKRTFQSCRFTCVLRKKTQFAFQEKLDTYRFCDNVWTFLLKVRASSDKNDNGSEERMQPTLEI